MTVAVLAVELANWLATEITGGGPEGLFLGRSLFIGRLPASGTGQLATAVIDTGSLSSDPVPTDRADAGNLGKIIAHHRDSTVQILTRSSRYEDGMSVQERIWLTLHGRIDFDLGSLLHCDGAEAFEVPQIIDEGRGAPGNREWYFSTNYALRVYNTSTV